MNAKCLIKLNECPMLQTLTLVWPKGILVLWNVFTNELGFINEMISKCLNGYVQSRDSQIKMK